MKPPFQIRVRLLVSLVSTASAGAATIITFEDALPGPLPTNQYVSVGARILGASIFHVPDGSWASARSGSQGLYPSSPVSSDGTSWTNVLAEHGIPFSIGTGSIADVYFVSPGTSQPGHIDQFSIGFGYDSDGGEPNQAVVIEAFDAADNKVLDAVRPNLYYDGYETFSAAGAVRLRFTQNGAVGFDDLAFDAPVAPRMTNVLSIRFSQVELCWASTSNTQYQVQYRSDLNTNIWTDLGAPVLGTDSTNCVYDAVLPGEPRRFYRFITSP